MFDSILLTGSTGYVGGNLLTFLSKNTDLPIYCILRDGVVKSVESGKTQHINEFSSYITKYASVCLIHAATKYVRPSESYSLVDIVNSNVIYPASIVDILKHAVDLSIINFNSSFQFPLYSDFTGSIYTNSKNIFYYHLKEGNVPTVNLFLYETFGGSDPRDKLLPNLKLHLTSNLKSAFNVRSTSQLLSLVSISDICIFTSNLLSNFDEYTGQDIPIHSNELLSIGDIMSYVQSDFPDFIFTSDDLSPSTNFYLPSSPFTTHVSNSFQLSFSRYINAY